MKRNGEKAMKNITIEQLNNIVALMDLEKIKAELSALGFRNASKYGAWEFDMGSIANATIVDGTEVHEDVFDDRTYHGDIHEQVELYPTATFVIITVKRLHRHLELESYEHLLCFTDLPINEEYEERQSQSKRCDCCKKTFTVGELCKVGLKGKERFVCDDCFNKIIREDIKKRTAQLAKRVGRK